MENPELSGSAISSARMSRGPQIPAWFFTTACGLLTAVYLAAALISISELPLLDPDEPRYAGAARTMAFPDASQKQSGSLLVPEFNGEPRINKPPLFYWLVALSDKLAGGASEASSRAPSVVMGLLMLWGTIWLGRKLYGPVAGLLAGLILAATPLFIALSRCCITDMTLSTFLAGTLAWLMLAMTGLAPPKKAGWIAAVLFGLAVLTKATAAFAVLLAVVIERALALPKDRRPLVAKWIPWMLGIAIVLSAAAVQCENHGKTKHASKHVKAATVAKNEGDDSSDESDVAAPKNIWTTLDSVLNKIALAIAFAVVVIIIVMAYRAERLAPAMPPGWKWGLLTAILMGLWWYVMLIGIQGWPQFKALVDFEIKQRVAGAVHREGMHYYLFLLPAVMFPWSVGLAGAIGTAWPTANPENTRTDTDIRTDRFLVAWLLGIAFFFSIPGAKLPTYVLPAMPAAALLTARFLIQFSKSDRRIAPIWIRLTLAIAAMLAVILLITPLLIQVVPKRLPDFVGGHVVGLWILAVVAAIVFPGSWFLAVRGRSYLAATILGAGTIGLILVAAPQLVGGLKQRSTKILCQQVAEPLKGCTRIKTLGVAAESLSYYLNRPVTALHWRPPAPDKTGIDKLNEMIGDGPPAALFVEKRFIPRIFGLGSDLNQTDLKKAIPANLVLVYSDDNVLVLRNSSQ